MSQDQDQDQDARPIAIHDRPERERYELDAGGAVAAIIDYRLRGQRIALLHTEVQPEHEGGGLGTQLARHALDDARRRGLKVVPSCSFIAAYVRRHPQYQDLVAD
ncbi:GNAT family N-acetyltransferase [Ramlibacter tataouinensis]|uniref:Uncharacterized protein n=1 Tax=Ramlibacter tataouinensis (strain ATCC BAA-407 / DSM 14655 / LMG 21543 / TTB310) TaxID=365046 RepID=F5XZ22_RAMTT|nr:GNAT family N-acetyltransferase [Ramlibacter tataouinensis]AEG92010.1 Conserved hypothetical protein [Ramlibacter tataouinensis TTB310]